VQVVKMLLGGVGADNLLGVVAEPAAANTVQDVQLLTLRRAWREGNGRVMLIVVARYSVTEGQESRVAHLLRRNAEASRAEPGCLEFSVYQEIDDARVFLLYERYTSEEAFQAHRRTPHFVDIIEQQVVPLLDKRDWTRVQPLPA
jgi:quinol monooxygenase YgiN